MRFLMRMDVFPLTASGKILKRELVQMVRRGELSPAGPLRPFGKSPSCRRPGQPDEVATLVGCRWRKKSAFSTARRSISTARTE
jgi:hypothetical protein